MALHAGSFGHSAGTLSDAIEHAFAAEVMGAKQAELPAAGKEDRALLFNAIAQGVLAYLAAHQDDFAITVTGAPGAVAKVRIMSPTLASAGTTVKPGGRVARVIGDRWPIGTAVRLTWDGAATPAMTVAPSSPAGGIDASPLVPPAATPPLRLTARNNSGDAVVVEVAW